MNIMDVHSIIITSINQFPKSINPLNDKRFVFLSLNRHYGHYQCSLYNYNFNKPIP